MEIRKAIVADCGTISRAVAHKHIDYITPAFVHSDIENEYMYIITDYGKIIAICSLVPNHRGYIAIKRLCILNNKNQGRGIANIFFNYFCSLGVPLGITPWTDNTAMQHLVNKYDFEYQYTFNKNYMFYLRRQLIGRTLNRPHGRFFHFNTLNQKSKCKFLTMNKYLFFPKNIQ